MWDQIRNKLASHTPLLRLYRLYKRARVIRRSPYENIYYCCTQKTASQWLKEVFSDFTVYKYTGLEVFPFTQVVLPLQDARFDGPLPKRTIGTHLYIDYATYQSIPKPDKYKTFFILRDPRDIVVSWYFSIRYSHSLIDGILEYRNELEKLGVNEGLKYSIDKLDDVGLFSLQRSWINISEDCEKVNIFRHEDLASDNPPFLKHLFDYLNIIMPDKEFIALCDRHRFQRYSGDRKQGAEDPKSHYRKGVSADWRNYFDSSTMTYFRQVTRDLLEVLEYQE